MTCKKGPTYRGVVQRFADGTEKEFRYDTLKYHKFKKCSKKDISVIEKLFTSSDGYRCTIIEDMDIDTDISPSLRRYKVKFDDDTTKVFKYKTLLSGKFKKIDNRCKE